VPSFFLGARQCTRFLTGCPLLCAPCVCVTEFELHHHLVSAMRPVSSYFVDVHFIRASTCNGFCFLSCVHNGRHSKFPVAKKVSIECHENCNATFVYFFPFDPACRRFRNRPRTDGSLRILHTPRADSKSGWTSLSQLGWTSLSKSFQASHHLR
jgi:hypothetical protein